MRVLVAGSRNFTDRDFLEMILDDVAADIDPIETLGGPLHTLVNGFAKGADRMAHEWAKNKTGWTTEVHYPEWRKHGRSAGYIRNQAMVESGADLCLIFYGPDGETRGTKHTETLAKDAGIETRVYFEEEEA